METTIYLRGSITAIESLFNKGINRHADLRYYHYLGDGRSKVIVRHNEGITLAENKVYTIEGLIKRCNPTYHIITFCAECGEDDKQDVFTLEQGIEECKEYLAEGYDWAKVVKNHKVVACYCK